MLAESRRDGRPVTLVMADLDYFKAINDRFGHLTGDRLLREAGALLQASVRDSDVLCRWGGEEFLLLLKCDAAEAERLADAMRCRLLTHEFTHEGRPLRITMSMGVAAFQPGDTLQTMVDRADRALFIAKDSGRNRVQTGR